MRPLTYPISIALCVIAVSQGSAAILAVSNLSELPFGAISFGSDVNLAAVSFQTGDTAVDMDSVEFLIGAVAGYQASTVSLYSSTVSAGSGMPNSSLSAWGYPNVTPSQTVSVDTGDYSLTANTEYFLVFSSTHVGAPNIAATVSPDQNVGDSGQVGSGWGIGNTHFVSANTGTDWTHVDSATGMIQINAVPEPASVALFFGFGAVVLLIRRRRHSS